VTGYRGDPDTDRIVKVLRWVSVSGQGLFNSALLTKHRWRVIPFGFTVLLRKGGRSFIQLAGIEWMRTVSRSGR
jgi:hypothetical protein